MCKVRLPIKHNNVAKALPLSQKRKYLEVCKGHTINLSTTYPYCRTSIPEGLWPPATSDKVDFAHFLIHMRDISRQGNSQLELNNFKLVSDKAVDETTSHCTHKSLSQKQFYHRLCNGLKLRIFSTLPVLHYKHTKGLVTDEHVLRSIGTEQWLSTTTTTTTTTTTHD